jgi:glycosyltransferase involved in cell wall biosynthesis
VKKTICFFNSNRAWGGGEKWHFTTALEFERRGYETFLVTNIHSELSKKAHEKKMNYFSFFVHNMSFLNPFKILSLVSLFRTHQIDTIIMNLPADLKLAGIAARIAGVKKIIYRRGMPHPIRSTWLNRFLFKKILTHVVVNSEEIGRSLVQNNEDWFPKEKIILIYNGIESTKPLPPKGERKSSHFVIGSAGRLTTQKGQKYLIEMAEILKEKGLGFELLIAGEGELKSELQHLIENADLENEVKLLGHVTDMTSFFHSLDVFVFPSLFEGSANTLIETLQHQIPTIAFDVSSNPEIIIHEKTGLLAKPFSSEELAAHVLDIFHHKEKATSFTQNGFKLVAQKFDSLRNLDQLQKIIDS